MPEKDALWALFAAYSIIFLLLFWFLTRIHGKTRAMEMEVRRLKDDLELDAPEITGKAQGPGEGV